MSDLFIKVPVEMLQKSSEHIKLYCELYLLEFTNKKYSLLDVSGRSSLSYRQSRGLQTLAKSIIKSNKPTIKQRKTK